MTQLHTDVIIVGGGPAGLLLAIELGRRQIRTILFDQDCSTTINPQANATQARTMEHYRRLGFANEVRTQGLPPNYPTDIAYFTTFSGYELARFQLPSADEANDLIKNMGGSWSAAELPHRVSQMYVEQVLHRQATRLKSVALRYQHEVTKVIDNIDHVEATVVTDKNTFVVSAQYLIGCDGPRSTVRKHLGITMEGEANKKRDFVGGYMHAVYLKGKHLYDAINGDPAWMHVNVNHRRRCFLAAIDGKSEFVFHTQLKSGEDKDNISEIQTRNMFAECMGRSVDFDIISRSSWTAGFTLVAEKLSVDRIFLAGDAAHLFTPTGGLGYNTAIEDAVNLGWKLAAVIKKWGGSRLLDSYQMERHPSAVRNTNYARGFAESLGSFKPKPELEAHTSEGSKLRAEASDYFNRHGREEFNIPGITFGNRYDGSPIIVSDGSEPPPDRANMYQPTACPGGRAPHLWLQNTTGKTTSLYDQFGFEFTLLCFDGGDKNIMGPLTSTAKSAGLLLSVVDVAGEEARELYQSNFALIRPDQIVAWRGDQLPEEPEKIIRVLTGK